MQSEAVNLRYQEVQSEAVNRQTKGTTDALQNNTQKTKINNTNPTKTKIFRKNRGSCSTPGTRRVTVLKE